MLNCDTNVILFERLAVSVTMNKDLKILSYLVIEISEIVIIFVC